MATKYCVAPTVKIESVKIELDEPCGPDGPEESCESCIVMCTQQRTMCAMLLGDLLDECARATRQDRLAIIRSIYSILMTPMYRPFLAQNPKVRNAARTKAWAFLQKLSPFREKEANLMQLLHEYLAR